MLKLVINSLFKCVSHKRHISIRHGQLFASDVHIAELENGIRVATQETQSPLACSSLFIKTGARFENECNHGITHFMEHLAFQGFKSLPKCDFEESITNSGTRLMVHTARDYQLFTAVSSGDNAGKCVDILINILTDLELSDFDIHLQKDYVASEAIDEDNNPKSVVFNYLNQTAFQGTPLSRGIIGPSINRMNFDREMICEYKQYNYQPHRILFVSTGCVSHFTNMCEINNRLCNWPPSRWPCTELGPRRFTGSSIIYRDDSMPYAHVALAVEAPGYNSPDYLPLLVASFLTGSWDRSQGGAHNNDSPLARAAAVSNLCEKFESFYVSYEDTGLWGVYFVSGGKAIDDMVGNIQDQWMQMCTTIRTSDVQRAVHLAKLKLANNKAGIIRSCKDIGLQLLYTSNWKSLSQQFADIKQLKNEDIKDLCYTYLYDKCLAVVAVGPTESLPDYTRIRAGMYWLRL
ncbi:cytochrome b-c1 complex subunit 1, mitochondrial-like [Bicyclus anynana]|uniref:Cytochrome b-c1 complex subunit 1, mitochondrial-like n=1 Tax=Bicyclus anynana TaxID=110368 RepID=A0ABM3M5K0_BICAN|nr:cytochrome b-c1 complex subunit 1, mitochondrial-like [Bicyclus anynana]